MTSPRAGGGDGPFVDVLLTHLDAVHRLARHLAPPGTSAEDLVQETYLRALAAGDRDVRDVRAWLLTICLNVMRSEARRRTRRPEQLVEPFSLAEVGRSPAGEPRGVGAASPDPAVAVEQSELRRSVGRALARLPEAQRDCIVLMDVVGCTAREVADLLECPRGTVLARVHRGRRRLAALLDDEGTPGAAGDRGGSR